MIQPIQNWRRRTLRDIVCLSLLLSLASPFRLQPLRANDELVRQGTATQINPRSRSGLDFYSQGGIVVDGVAYFTANDYSRRADVKRTDQFPCVVAFDVNTFEKIREYNFGFTYDSSPLVLQRQDGTWLVIAHEHKNARSVAMNRETGQVEWSSDANQPGSIENSANATSRSKGA